MKIKKMLLVLCGLCAICTGCAKAELPEESFTKGEEANMIRELTKEQEELLCAISVNKEKVQDGKLYDWQVEVLNQFEYASEYLAEKYPSYSFKMVNCVPKNKTNSYTIFSFTEQSDNEKFYDLYLYVSEGEENIYEAKDNFYGEIKEEELAEALLKLLQEEFPECVEVVTNVPYVQGREYDETLNVNQIISGELKMSQDTTIYMQSEALAESEYQEKVKAINEFLTDKGIKGSYMILFVEKSEEETELYKGNFGI